MYKEVEIKCNVNDGVVMVKVQNAGYVNQGVFSLNMTDGTAVNKIGSGSFSDEVPDAYILPILPPSLSDWMLILAGNYKAAFGHNEISVDYVFYQKNIEIQREQIRFTGSSLFAHYDFTFKCV